METIYGETECAKSEKVKNVISKSKEKESTCHCTELGPIFKDMATPKFQAPNLGHLKGPLVQVLLGQTTCRA